MTNKYGVGDCAKGTLEYKYLGMPVTFKYRGLVMKGKVHEIHTYSRKPIYTIKLDDTKYHAEFNLDKNSFKEIKGE